MREVHLAYVSCNHLQPSVELSVSYEVHKVLAKAQLETPLIEANTLQPGTRPADRRKLL